jgi:hypothetical protein
MGKILKPFDVFICHKKSSGKDFADHLKAGLEELGYHTFLDSKDIPKFTDGKEEWADIRDNAIRESKTFILLITPGFDMSQEVKNELKFARAFRNKQFIYFRHRDLGRKIIVDLESEKLNLGKQEQVSFETKEELLRLAYGILLKSSLQPTSNQPETPVPKSMDTVALAYASPLAKAEVKCEMCLKPIQGQPLIEIIRENPHNFDCKECAQTFKKLRSMYGEDFS